MTIDDAIRLLASDTTSDAIAEIEYYNGLQGKAAAIQAIEDALDIAVNALCNQQARENPQPLTVDELRQMDGQPVWVVFDDNSAMWVTVDNSDVKELRLTTNWGGQLEFSVCKKTIKAIYRYPPKEVQ